MTEFCFYADNRVIFPLLSLSLLKKACYQASNLRFTPFISEYMSQPLAWQDSLYVAYETFPNGNIRARLQLPYGVAPQSFNVRSMLGARTLDFDILRPPNGFRQGTTAGTLDLPFNAQAYGTTLGIIPAVVPLAPPGSVTSQAAPVQLRARPAVSSAAVQVNLPTQAELEVRRKEEERLRQEAEHNSRKLAEQRRREQEAEKARQEQLRRKQAEELALIDEELQRKQKEAQMSAEKKKLALKAAFERQSAKDVEMTDLNFKITFATSGSPTTEAEVDSARRAKPTYPEPVTASAHREVVTQDWTPSSLSGNKL